ncbi:hypothetical protein GCM10010429_16060 [Micromonospora olivasterospora]
MIAVARVEPTRGHPVPLQLLHPVAPEAGARPDLADGELLDRAQSTDLGRLKVVHEQEVGTAVRR